MVRAAQLYGWYTTGRKSLLFYLLPWAFLVQYGWYTAGRKSLLFYLLPWAFLVQHNWMGGTRQGESPYYSIFYLGRSSSSTTGWVVHDREKVITILSFTLGVPRPAQLDGWYTTGRKSLLFYLLPRAFLVQHNWMGGTRQGESPYYSIFYLGRSSSSTTGWVVHGREKVLLFYLLPWAFLVQHNWMGGTRHGESRYYSIFYLGRSSSSTTGWVVHGREKVLTILSFTLGVPRPA